MLCLQGIASQGCGTVHITMTILSFRIDSCNELWYNMYKNWEKLIEIY